MITLKGTKEGIVILLDKTLTLEQTKLELAEKLGQAKGFFTGAAILVQLKSDTFSEFELYLLQTEIKKLLDKTEVQFVTELKPEPSAPKQKPADVLHKGTVRSGQTISAEGNLVVLGDANPGSELLAGGSIVVMGAARGVVHAGVYGDRTAVVTAAILQPSQIRIADMIARRPDGEHLQTEFYPEFAEIKGNSIVIERKLRETL